ncbi:response regulator [Paenarthrobacter sp. NPDC089675]|uniref:response regulator n=1 Tax=Paenarthrobacter sp. NPDC089675 TaxID=3364376 RepID=UPI0038083D3A
MNRVRVAIADDDPHLRASLRLLVDDAGDMTACAVAADGAEAVEVIVELKPDVALLDIRMPRMDGLEAAKMLAALGSPTKLVMLTTFDLDQYVFEALRHGASGFLLKNAPLESILGAIRTVYEGHALLAPEVTRRLVDRFSAAPPAGAAPTAGTDPTTYRAIQGLSDRERETLTLIARGLSNDRIAAEMFVTRTTARTYVSRLLAKLEARDRAQLVVMAYEGGLLRAPYLP